MSRALYNRDTLAQIRGLTVNGKGVHAIAREIEWSPDDLRRVGLRHGIPLIEDTDTPPAKAIALIAAAAPIVIEPAPTPSQKPEKRPLPPRAVIAGRDPGGARIRRDHTENPRSEYLTVAVSKAAIKGIDKIAHADGFARTSIVGVVIDYLSRANKLRALFDEAMAEGK